MTRYSEDARQIVHMAMGAFAFLLRDLTTLQAALLALTALGFNWWILPRLFGARLIRPRPDRSRDLGVIHYPLAVLGLVLAFPSRPDIAASGWGILAAGDGMATLVGRRAGGRRWPWNGQKTIAGSAAFALAGTMAGIVLAWWTAPAVAPRPTPLFIVAAPLVAALIAALAETIPIRLDDNLTVSAVGGATLWTISLMSAAAAFHAIGLLEARTPAAVAVSVGAAAAAWLTRSVSVSGALSGALVGVIVYLALGLNGWLLLLAAFVAAAATSRAGIARKRALGIAEGRGGRRGPGNVIGNCGIAAAAAAVALAPVNPAVGDLAGVAFAAALTAGASDTVASEIGKAFGRRTFLVTTLSRVAPGTSGAMSAEGTLAGLASAAAMAILAAGLGVVTWPGAVAIVIGATAGALIESALGATLEADGTLNNDVLNFINTAVAAGVAIALSLI